MSRAERRALVERDAPALPVSRQCQLLAVSRASGEGEPGLAAEAALGNGAPENENVDAAVLAAGSRVARQAERRSDAGPGLYPGHAALFELSNDLVGDLLVQAVAVRKGFVGVDMWTIGFADRLRLRSHPHRHYHQPQD